MMERTENKNQLIKKQKDNLFLLSVSLIFNEHIDKLWLFLKDLSNEISILDFLDKFKYIKGDNTWTIGNSFSFYWIGVSYIKGLCVLNNDNPKKKEIKWKFKCDIGINYYKSLILYNISQNDKTLVKVIVSRTEKENNLIDISQSLNYYSELHNNILLKQSQYLQNIKKDIIIYESCIINKNYLKIWNIIKDFQKIMDLWESVVPNFEMKKNDIEQSSFVKLFDKNFKRVLYFRVNTFELTNKKTYIYRLESIGSNTIDIPKIIDYKIIEINDNKCQLSFLFKFDYKCKNQIIKDFNINKNSFIKNIIKAFRDNLN